MKLNEKIRWEKKHSTQNTQRARAATLKRATEPHSFVEYHIYIHVEICKNVKLLFLTVNRSIWQWKRFGLVAHYHTKKETSTIWHTIHTSHHTSNHSNTKNISIEITEQIQYRFQPNLVALIAFQYNNLVARICQCLGVCTFSNVWQLLKFIANVRYSLQCNVIDCAGMWYSRVFVCHVAWRCVRTRTRW